MTSYVRSIEWADVTRVPLQEPNDAPARILYAPRYEEVMGYFRAVLASGETSPRVLSLSADAISLNASNYTAWQLRRSCLSACAAALPEQPGPSGRAAFLRQELVYIARVAEDGSKNYQLWHHRRWLINLLGDPVGELTFTARHLVNDAKNYHAWAHRQWVIARYGLWDGGTGDEAMDGGELGFTEALLATDCRNNSAWNHRWFIVTRGGGRPAAPDDGPDGSQGAAAAGVHRQQNVLDDDVIARELTFALSHCTKVTLNESSWRYARALVRTAPDPARRRVKAWPLTGAAQAVRNAASPGCNVHANEILAEAALESAEEAEAGQVTAAAPGAAGPTLSTGRAWREQAAQLYVECEESDPVRSQYWAWRQAVAMGMDGQ